MQLDRLVVQVPRLVLHVPRSPCTCSGPRCTSSGWPWSPSGWSSAGAEVSRCARAQVAVAGRQVAEQSGSGPPASAAATSSVCWVMNAWMPASSPSTGTCRRRRLSPATCAVLGVALAVVRRARGLHRLRLRLQPAEVVLARLLQLDDSHFSAGVSAAAPVAHNAINAHPVTTYDLFIGIPSSEAARCGRRSVLPFGEAGQCLSCLWTHRASPAQTWRCRVAAPRVRSFAHASAHGALRERSRSHRGLRDRP